MEMAIVASQYSHATRLKVGSIFVKDGRILSIGINGTISGHDNSCEEMDANGNLVTKHTVIHSEQQGMYKAARDGESLKGSTLFVTAAPCTMCSLGLISVGVSEVYYLDEYRLTEGLQLLKDANILVEKFKF